MSKYLLNVINLVNIFMEQPQDLCLQVIKTILWYFKETFTLGMFYKS
jgi:hypothetical protein